MTTEVHDPEVGDSTRRRVPTWFLVAVVGVGLTYGVVTIVGRSGSPDATEALDEEDAPRATLIDPCSLVTADEAGAVLGPVGEPTERPGMGVVPGQRACFYPLAESPQFGVVIGVLEHAEGMNLAGVGTEFGITPEFVGEVGDDARWLWSFRILAIAVGDTFLSVQFVAPHEPVDEARTKAVGLAVIAGGRL